MQEVQDPETSHYNSSTACTVMGSVMIYSTTSIMKRRSRDGVVFDVEPKQRKRETDLT